MTITQGRVLRLTGASLACLALACTSSLAPGADDGGGAAPGTGGIGGGPPGGSGGSVSSGGSGGGGAPTGGGGTSAGGASGGAAGGADPVGGAGAAGASGIAGQAGDGVAGGGTSGGGTGGAGAGGGGTGGGAAGSAGMAGGGGSGPSTCPFTPPTLPATFPANWTSGTVITFNDDGAWTWYSDERVIVDAAGGKLIISSDANGGSRNGNVDVVIHDLATGMNSRFVLGDLAPDDHNNGAILVKAPGEYLAFWAGHNENCNTYWRNYSGTQWGAQQLFNWSQHSAPCPWTASMRSVTYNNLFKMSAEAGKLYNFTRTVDTSPNFLVSTNNGQTWTYGGRLTLTPQVGYVAGYYKYWGNDVDRIDFLATEAHPRDNDNSLYHGYIKGGQVYDSLDRVVDSNLNDTNAREIVEYTRVFQTGTTLQGLRLNRLWNFDVVRYADGTIGALSKARVNGTQGEANPDHRILYSRFNGTTWTSTYLVKGGSKLYDSEQDYVGGAALDPDDPHVIYVSTPFDPRDDTTMLGRREIWKGVTCNNGATFTWTPVTMNSAVDNLRPVVPKWNANNTALLWFRGTYQTAQIYDEEVVGIITRNP